MSWSFNFFCRKVVFYWQHFFSSLKVWYFVGIVKYTCLTLISFRIISFVTIIWTKSKLSFSVNLASLKTCIVLLTVSIICVSFQTSVDDMYIDCPIFTCLIFLFVLALIRNWGTFPTWFFFQINLFSQIIWTNSLLYFFFPYAWLPHFLMA